MSTATNPQPASTPERPVPPAPKRRGLPPTAVLLAGVVLGTLSAAIGLGYALASGQDDKPEEPRLKEEVFLEYRADPQNGHVNWADYTSAADTFLLIRFQSEPEVVYVTKPVDDNPGFPQPEKIVVPRPFLDGEIAYVYLLDDDGASNQFWKDVSRNAVKRGGAVAGRLASVWTLGQVPSDQVIAFSNEAGERIGEMTLDGNDVLACAQVPVRSVPLDFGAPDGRGKAETSLSDPDGGEAGALKVVYGHRTCEKIEH